jgi:Tfp pilus assembly protein PilF
VTLLAHLQRSKAYEKIGYEDKVIADLTTVINAAKKAKDANVAGVYFSRGNAYVRKQDYKKAIADFTQVIKLEPHAEVAYRARAEAYQQRGKSDLAQADYSAAVNIAGQRGAATS